MNLEEFYAALGAVAEQNVANGCHWFIFGIESEHVSLACPSGLIRCPIPNGAGALHCPISAISSDTEAFLDPVNHGILRGLSRQDALTIVASADNRRGDTAYSEKVRARLFSVTGVP